MSEKKNNQVSRRQFLNYTLTGVGGFMGAAMVSPMVGMAVDPLLQAEGSSDYQYVMDVSEITKEPQRKSFTVPQKDGWYESDSEQTAWVYRTENDEILALSPVCTHLGCTVDWESGGHDNEFFCPCHGGRYNRKGVNIADTPPTAPLPAYEYRVEEGKLYLGKAQPRGGA